MAEDKKFITVSTVINAPLDKVWQCWITPADITQWNNATEDWITPEADNDLKKGGRFVYRMEAKDKSMGFDFGGTYDEVKEKELLKYTLDDKREVDVTFSEENNTTTVTEKFEPETTNPEEMQQQGWQMILDNFKKYVENKR